MKKDSKIYIAGHQGMVGSAIVRNLKAKGYHSIITASREEVNLLNQESVETFFKRESPEYIFVAAAKVGGIVSNKTYPADFIYQNMVMEANIIHAAHTYKATKLLFLGSSCIYPKMAPQPITEDALLTGPLEPTNEYYAIAKIAGLKLCEAYRAQYGDNFIAVMPTNLYGPNDNYNLQNSHVLPAMIRKFHEAQERGDAEVVIWGTGSPMREFLHVDDLADACVFLMETYDGGEVLNIGTGVNITIRELAETVQRIVGFSGNLVFDTTKPDGTPRKLLNVSKLHSLGWKHTIDLEEGIRKTYDSFKQELASSTLRDK